MHHSISFFYSTLKAYLLHKFFAHCIVSLTFSDLSHGFYDHVGLNSSSFFFVFVSLCLVLYLFSSSDRLSWFYQLLNCTYNLCTFLSIPLLFFFFFFSSSSFSSSSSSSSFLLTLPSSSHYRMIMLSIFCALRWVTVALFIAYRYQLSCMTMTTTTTTRR